VMDEANDAADVMSSYGPEQKAAGFPSEAV
jgi:hypothetical protein